MNNNGVLVKEVKARVEKPMGEAIKNFALVSGLGLALCVWLLALSTNGVALANPGEALWGTISGLIGTWVTRLGAVVMFAGFIMFGLGWKNDDAEGKSRGISTVAAGGIVTGAAAMIGQFFA